MLSLFENMAGKNFVFQENWLGSEVPDMKTTCLAIVELTWTHILIPKSPNKEFFK